MKKTPVHTDFAPKAIGPYSQAIRAGNMIFCSGQIALTPAGQVDADDVAGQTRQALANLEAVLTAAGTDLQHVVKTTVFLTSMDDFAAMNEAYAQFFPSQPPARSTVAVADLPRHVRVEIECIALVDTERPPSGATDSTQA
jgi:2-iminobutanoate/2-iminopropanoate deaminase